MSEKKEKKEDEKKEVKEEKKEVKEEKKEGEKGDKPEKKGEEEKKSHVRHQGKPFLQIEDSKRKSPLSFLSLLFFSHLLRSLTANISSILEQQWVINPSFVVYGRSGGGNSKNEVKYVIYFSLFLYFV